MGVFDVPPGLGDALDGFAWLAALHESPLGVVSRVRRSVEPARTPTNASEISASHNGAN